jgi:hypothetical protein
MWNLLRAEIGYWKYTLVLFFLVPPILVIYEIFQGAEPLGFLAMTVLVIMLSTWLALRVRENIDASLSSLPIPHRQIAASRILMVIVVSCAYQLLYSLLRLSSRPAGLTLMSELAGPTVVVTLFSLLLIMRDLVTGTKYLYVIKASIAGAAGLLALASVMLARQIERAGGGAERPAIISVVDFIIKHRPSINPVAFGVSVGLFALLTYLTTVSYAHRRTQIEQP